MTIDTLTKTNESKQKHEIFYYPLTPIKDNLALSHKESLLKVKEIYENTILKKIKEFGNQPTNSFNPQKEF